MHEVAVGILAFEHRGQEWRIHIAGCLLRRFNVLGRLQHRADNHCILRQANLRPARCIRANRPHSQTMREDSMVPNLIHGGIRQFEARRELPCLIPRIGKAYELVRGHEVVHAVAQVLRHETCIIREGF